MNERINNLRLDAGISQLKDDPRLVVIDREGNVIDPLIGLEKFAELIVRECAHVALMSNGNNLHVFTLIKEHFGVEE
jgi:hypothetical protein